jgi:hypothetical protein
MPVAVAVAIAATPPRAATTDGVSGRRARSGAWESHEKGPRTSLILLSEISTKARTRRGSNCVPEQRTISERPSAVLNGSLYELADVMTSNASPIATMRPARGICSPATPRGYPYRPSARGESRSPRSTRRATPVTARPALAVQRVETQALPLRIRGLAGFVEDLLTDRELSDVVEKGGPVQAIQLVVVEPELLAGMEE